MLDKYDELYSQAIQTKSRYETIKQQLDSLIAQKEGAIATMNSQIVKHNTYEKAISYMKEIIDTLSQTHIKHLELLLNSAVATIFFDKAYSIEFEISEFRNSNCLTIYLVETLESGEIVKTDLKDNGFGVKTIVGFILQIYFILYNKLNPILFIDEGLSAVSSEYLPNIKELLNNLKDQYGFIFVLVAHDPRFFDIADKMYEVRNGQVKLKQ